MVTDPFTHDMMNLGPTWDGISPDGSSRPFYKTLEASTDVAAHIDIRPSAWTRYTRPSEDEDSEDEDDGEGEDGGEEEEDGESMGEHASMQVETGDGGGYQEERPQQPQQPQPQPVERVHVPASLEEHVHVSLQGPHAADGGAAEHCPKCLPGLPIKKKGHGGRHRTDVAVHAAVTAAAAVAAAAAQVAAAEAAVSAQVVSYVYTLAPPALPSLPSLPLVGDPGIAGGGESALAADTRSHIKLTLTRTRREEGVDDDEEEEATRAGPM